MSSASERPPVVASLGEPGGIGPEIALDAWAAAAAGGPGRPPPFAVVGDAAVVEERARLLGRAAPVERIDPGADGALARAGRAFADALPVLHEPLGAPCRPGEIRDDTAPGVIRSLERALALVASGAAPALVTLPIAKGVLMRAGFEHAGHTGWLSERTGAEALMLFVSERAGLRVAPLTVHVPLSRAPGLVSAEALARAARTLDRGLREDFGIEAPRVAVAGLNPHAGEDGAIGREEVEVVVPTLERLRAEGLDLRGPFSADVLFHEEARRRCDAVLAMYHDQALAPFKALDFLGGAQVSLGLPVVRASPDHGPAVDIAGRGEASAASLISALRLAAASAERRREAGALPSSSAP